jgi:hypothetical protein
MSDIKTKQTTASVTDFLNSVQDKTKREDAFILLDRPKDYKRKDRSQVWHKSLGQKEVHKKRLLLLIFQEKMAAYILWGAN